MSGGLIVRPGDKLFLPTSGETTIQEREFIKRTMEGEMPDVNVVVLGGFSCDAFVYRPDASAEATP